MENLEDFFKCINDKEILNDWDEMFKSMDILNLWLIKYIYNVEKNLDFNYKFDEILKKSLFRVLKVFNEIILLLRNGFVEGAMARWRTLYEIILILVVIMESEDREAISRIYINNQKKVDASFLQEFMRISKKENSNWDKLNIDESSLKGDKLEIYRMAKLNKKIKYDNYPFSNITSLKAIIDKFSPEDYKIDYLIANWCIHSGNYRSLDLLEDIDENSNSIITKYGIDEVIGSTVSLLMFLFIKLFKDNIIIEQDFRELLYLKNLIADNISKARKEIYNYD